MLETPVTSSRVAEQSAELLERLFRRLDSPVRLRLWNGRLLTLGNPGASVGQPPAFTLVCRSPAAVRAMALGRDPLRMAELYFRGELDIEGDFFAALELKDHLDVMRIPLGERLRAFWAALPLGLPGTASDPACRVPTVRSHTRDENRRAIAYHYDVSNDFYALWLDAAMVYSCAYFESAADSLERAQQAKLDLICRKLLLRPGEHYLDIGCGWGALVVHAAKHYGVRAHGVVLSERQWEFARARVKRECLEDRVTIELRDYRDLEGEGGYDKVSSVGMFEHIGLHNLPAYFAKVHGLLRPGGLFLNHGITHESEGWKKTLSSEFINRYVFPDGQLDTVSNVQRGMERAHFEIIDVESLRPHYALTLRHWVGRLERRKPEALHHVGESTWRIWRLYMAACALEFETGDIGVYQVLGSRRAGRAAVVPMTRRHLFTGKGYVS